MSDVTFNEYGSPVPACFRNVEPGCPHTAVIPAVTVEDTTGIKNISDCLVHISNTNTTMYIDDKHRMMVVWAGPVEVDNYDFVNNPRGLRSQMVIDYVNNKAAYYNATGAIRYITISEA